MNRVVVPGVTPAHAVLRRGARLIGRSLRAHPGPHSIAIVGANLYALAVVGWTVVLGRITDRVIVPAFESGRPAKGTVAIAVAAVLTAGVVRSIGTLCRRLFLAIAMYRTQRTWRREIIDTYLDAPLAFYQRHPTGELLATADNDIETSTVVLRPLAYSLGVVMLGLYALVSLLFVHLLLAAVAAVLFPTLALINHVYTRRVEVPAATVQERIGDVSSIAHESFDGVMAVKTLGIEREEVARLRVAATALRDARVRGGGYRATFEPTIDALPELGMIGLLGLGSWLVSRGVVSLGQLVQATALFTMLAVPMRIVGYFLEEMPRSVAARDRVDRILADRPGATGPATSRLPADGLDVEAHDLAYAYGAERRDRPAVLDGIDLSVAAGSSLAVVGPTGAGKSTLALVLAGLVDPTRGAVRVGGMDLGAVAAPDRTARVAIVFQETVLFADTVRENVTLGRPVAEEELRRVTDLVHATAFIDAMPAGFDTVVGERGVTLSGGQRQRIALARALIRSPRVLILDDATSAVDPVVEERILDNLRRELALTLIVVAYRVSTIRLADRVAYLRQGRVIATGTHQALSARADYGALVRAYELGARGEIHA
jgi:ABC-type multidrug transport system fused ATPase/permease subunit